MWLFLKTKLHRSFSVSVRPKCYGSVITNSDSYFLQWCSWAKFNSCVTRRSEHRTSGLCTSRSVQLLATSSFTFPSSLPYRRNRDGAINTAARLRAVRFRSPVGARKFALLQNNQTGSGIHPNSYSMYTGGAFAGPGR